MNGKYAVNKKGVGADAAAREMKRSETQIGKCLLKLRCR